MVAGSTSIRVHVRLACGGRQVLKCGLDSAVAAACYYVLLS